MTWHLVKPGGAILAMKGVAAEDEIKELQAPKGMASVQLHTITLGELEPSRIVEVRKAG